MTIEIGQNLPALTLTLVNGDGKSDVAVADYFAGKKVVLFGVPGAYTPTCSNNHLPGFLENSDAILAKGVDKITCISVNDAWVMSAWLKDSGAENRIDFLADGNGEFAKATGLDLDLSGGGLGQRSKRFSMLIDDGKVTLLNIEEQAVDAETSSAAQILTQL